MAGAVAVGRIQDPIAAVERDMVSLEKIVPGRESPDPDASTLVWDRIQSDPVRADPIIEKDPVTTVAHGDAITQIPRDQVPFDPVIGGTGSHPDPVKIGGRSRPG